LETTSDLARDIVINCRDELTPDKYVQSEDRILNVAPENYQAINKLMDDILSFLVQNDD